MKVVACAHTGIFLHLELQRGKDAMRQAEFANETLKTSACTARLMKYTSKTWDSGEEMAHWKRPTYYGDAWFGSVPSVLAAAQNNCNLVCVVKTAHRQYPKKYLQDKMKPWPPGSNLVLQATIHGVKMYAVGYKYSKHKVLCFLYNHGAGTIQRGEPYVAKWKDRRGNTHTKYVPRPDVISRYFADSNKVDTHNQARQFDLHLEKAWVSRCGFFRLATTLFGLCVVDAWKGYKHHLCPRHRHYDIGIKAFTSILCKDLLENKCSRRIVLPPNSFNLRYEDAADAASGGPAVGMIVGTEEHVDVPADEGITQDSYVNAITPDRLGLRHIENPKAESEPEETAKPEVTHNLLKNDEWTTETQEIEDEETGETTLRMVKRRKRGLCFNCKKKTAFFCPDCPTRKQVLVLCRWVREEQHLPETARSHMDDTPTLTLTRPERCEKT